MRIAQILALVAIALALLVIGRELHSIHYELVFKRCVLMARAEMTCKEAKAVSNGAS